MRRRRFLEAGASLAALSFVSRIALGDEPKIACERVVARVGTNHGHTFVVPAADAKAGGDKTYDLTGTANHGHSVTISSDDWKRINKGEIVRMPCSKEGGHLHRLLIKCAPLVDPPELANVCQIEIGGKDDHEMSVTAADIAAKAERVFDIQGIAPHAHSIKITSADFERLIKGEQLVITSTAGDGHTHVVFVKYPKKP
jgi:hypothetical protein